MANSLGAAEIDPLWELDMEVFLGFPFSLTDMIPFPSRQLA